MALSPPKGSNEHVDMLLDAADPLHAHDGPLPDAEVFLRELHRDDGRQLAAQTQSPPRRRRRIAAIWTTVVLVGLVGIATPAVATVQRFLAQTGVFSSLESDGDEGEETEVTPGYEWIEATARDYADYALTVYDLTLPLPDGYTASDVGIRVAAQQVEIAGGYGSSVLQQESNVRRTYESAVRCVWISSWLKAEEEGDAAQQNASAEVLLQSASWPMTVETDGGGVVDSLVKYAEGARAGDVGLVKEAYQSDACSTFMEAIDE
ncbi:hypothetical protein [Mycetocola zhadangensis]|uniref:Uncharacterized protein n=1 Tax=Mycetocola zhadangensis TaxID=1164595 RepID=A0A3L7IUX4_9MICO|nr:hypothetical protein [Mycetocola zhadangensis]RLQ81251.1 hypothetical protein D9V28_12800 [Mycetocola zhadangensis]GGF03367.1 hypothetical protein GCM10011313_28130 [Mycetocola zhadangensis]